MMTTPRSKMYGKQNLIWLLLLCGCQSAMYFGTEVIGTNKVPNPHRLWFADLPQQYVVKHLASAQFGSRQLDLIVYMLAKNGKFRVLAMNEIGMKLFDIYALEDQPPTIVKPPPKLIDEQALMEMTTDIRQVFFSRRYLRRHNLREYQNSKSQIFVHNKGSAWRSWEMRNGQPMRTARGRGNIVETTIDYKYQQGTIYGFPKNIAISHHLTGFSMQLTILSITAKQIADEKFITNNVR